MTIEIQLTPRGLEKIIIGCIILVILVMSPIIYNSYKHSQLAETENNVSGAVVSAGQKEEEKAKVEEVTKEEPKTETTTTTETEASGNVDITIAPIRYQIKESATYRKAVIDTLSFIVYNDRGSTLNMKVNVYHSNSKTSEDYNNNPRTILEFPAIGTGEHKTKTFFNVQGLNLYNVDLDQNLKFVFEDSSGKEIKTLTKVLKIE